MACMATPATHATAVALLSLEYSRARAGQASAAVRPDESHPSGRVKKAVASRARNLCASRQDLDGGLCLAGRRCMRATISRSRSRALRLTRREAAARRRLGPLVRAHGGGWPYGYAYYRRVASCKKNRQESSVLPWPEPRRASCIFAENDTVPAPRLWPLSLVGAGVGLDWLVLVFVRRKYGWLIGLSWLKPTSEQAESVV